MYYYFNRNASIDVMKTGMKRSLHWNVCNKLDKNDFDSLESDLLHFLIMMNQYRVLNFIHYYALIDPSYSARDLYKQQHTFHRHYSPLKNLSATCPLIHTNRGARLFNAQ